MIATIGGKQEKPPICFTGHIDIVPLGAAKWSKDLVCRARPMGIACMAAVPRT